MRLFGGGLFVLLTAAFMSGCAHQSPSKPEYYENVETVPFSSSQFTNLQTYIDLGATSIDTRLFARESATKIDDDEIKLFKYYFRKDTDQLVAISEYHYKDTDNGQMKLTEHIAKQTGYIGSYPIPVLTISDISLLASGKENSDNWKGIKNASPLGEVYVARLEGSSQNQLFAVAAPTSTYMQDVNQSYADPNEPSLLVLTKTSSCNRSGYSSRAIRKMVKVNNLPVQALVWCAPFSQPMVVFKLIGVNKALKTAESQLVNADQKIDLIVDNTRYKLKLAGFTYAEQQVRAIQ